MKNALPWGLFFLVCLGVGFLHGILPQGISKNYFNSPTKVQIHTTDEIFFPPHIRTQIEDELNVKFSVLVTRDWDSILANMVAESSVDLIFLPSYWANTLTHQNLLSNVSGSNEFLRKKLAPDFSGNFSKDSFTFLPLYWIKTSVFGRAGESFENFINNPKENILFLLADEDLILKHFEVWKEQGLYEKISKKKILALQLDQMQQEDGRLGAIEAPIINERQDLETYDRLGALLVYGAAIPLNSTQKDLSLAILDKLTEARLQERNLLTTPFNSTLSDVKSNEIPLQRRAEFIRNLQLKNILLIDQKDKDAKIKLRDEYNFIL